jgi:hypothetical protein
VWWSFVIIGLLVVLVSAAVRLGFYVWWRGRFGGRPVRLRRKAPARADDSVTIRWDDAPRS